MIIEIKSGVSTKITYKMCRARGVAQNGITRLISKPNTKSANTMHVHTQKLRQKSQSSISAIIDAPILS